jgi:hypothetical protein
LGKEDIGKHGNRRREDQRAKGDEQIVFEMSSLNVEPLEIALAVFPEEGD